LFTWMASRRPAHPQRGKSKRMAEPSNPWDVSQLEQVSGLRPGPHLGPKWDTERPIKGKCWLNMAFINVWGRLGSAGHRLEPSPCEKDLEAESKIRDSFAFIP